MFIILLYFVYLAIVFFIIGFAVKSILKIQGVDWMPIYLLGISTTTFFFTFVAFFLPINYWTSVLYHFIVLGCFLIFRNNIVNEIPIYFNKYKVLEKRHKLTMLLGLMVVLLVSAMPPFLIDNESYYVQSIKWLNQFGLVKGLANLHPFLGQMSGWHILESGVNMRSFGINTNDLNGFVLLLFILDALKNVCIKKYQYAGILFLLPICLFFVSSPSPDLPVLICTPWLVIKLLEQDKSIKSNLGFIMPLVFAFLIVVKIISLPFLGLLFLIQYTNAQKRLALAILIVAFILIVTKNYILTGWLTYPFPWIDAQEFWSLPKEFYRFESKSTAISNGNIFRSILWLILIAIILGVGIFLIVRFKRFKVQWVFAIALIQIIVVFVHGVTLRLALPGMVVLIIIAWHFLKERSFIIQNRKIGYATIIILTMLVVLMLNGKEIKSNKNQIGHGGNPFEVSDILFPAGITRFENMKFSKLKIGNLEVNTPNDESFLFGTYNGELPCVSRKQIRYFNYKFRTIPQKIGESIEDGFYSKNDTIIN
uniref:LIC_10190 family membrane protein n=1 Tax=Flavobacterium sp. TaxID=239 RepID=UPI0040499852